jgi:hypothetical protein
MIDSIGQNNPSPDALRVVDGDAAGIRRNRFLALAGATLVAFGAKLAVPEAGMATTPPCYGFRDCNCCNVPAVCCEGGCVRVSGFCPSGGECWTGCYNHNRYWCCDHHSGWGDYCICRQISCSNCC